MVIKLDHFSPFFNCCTWYNYIWPELNNLTSLLSLEFGGNEIESFKSFHGTGDDLLRLRNLEKLVLNVNRFNDSTLSSLKGLSSLKSLDIAYNQLKGSFNVTELDASINLEGAD